jgi:hypothetical protein
MTSNIQVDLMNLKDKLYKECKKLANMKDQNDKELEGIFRLLKNTIINVITLNNNSNNWNIFNNYFEQLINNAFDDKECSDINFRLYSDDDKQRIETLLNITMTMFTYAANKKIKDNNEYRTDDVKFIHLCFMFLKIKFDDKHIVRFKKILEYNVMDKTNQRSITSLEEFVRMLEQYGSYKNHQFSTDNNTSKLFYDFWHEQMCKSKPKK